LPKARARVSFNRKVYHLKTRGDTMYLLHPDYRWNQINGCTDHRIGIIKGNYFGISRTFDGVEAFTEEKPIKIRVVDRPEKAIQAMGQLMAEKIDRAKIEEEQRDFFDQDGILDFWGIEELLKLEEDGDEHVIISKKRDVRPTAKKLLDHWNHEELPVSRVDDWGWEVTPEKVREVSQVYSKYLTP
jgi:hypothetical protein